MLMLTSICGCEDMVREIDVDLVNAPPCLTMSAYIDAYTGSFYLNFAEARPLGMYKTYTSGTKEITRKGIVSLYENDVLFYQRTSDDESNGVFNMPLEEYSYSGYFHLEPNLHFTAGKTYTLKLNIEGYPEATSTVVMPDKPNIDNVNLNRNSTVLRYNVEKVDSYNSYIEWAENKLFHPLNLHITDNSAANDYYIFRLLAQYTYQQDMYYPIATSNNAIVQSCPDVDNTLAVFDTEGHEPDAYIFSSMLISDLAFANTMLDLELLVDNSAFLPERDYIYNGQWHGDVYYPGNGSGCKAMYLQVSHISPTAFDSYRSLLLHSEGVGFFTEPVSIASNVQGGYGCFTAVNTLSTKIY